MMKKRFSASFLVVMWFEFLVTLTKECWIIAGCLSNLVFFSVFLSHDNILKVSKVKSERKGWLFKLWKWTLTYSLIPVLLSLIKYLIGCSHKHVYDSLSHSLTLGQRHRIPFTSIYSDGCFSLTVEWLTNNAPESVFMAPTCLVLTEQNSDMN